MKLVKLIGLALTALISVSACAGAISKSKSVVNIQSETVVSTSGISKFFSKTDKVNAKRQLVRVVAEGDLIITQSKVTSSDGESDIVGNLLRVIDGKLSNEWEVIQKEVPKAKTANGNSMIDGGGDVTKTLSKAELERNKNTVIDFIQKGFAQGDKATLVKLFGNEYTQHNPRVPNGKEAVLSFIPQQGQGFPAKIKQIVAQGDLVAALVEYGSSGANFHNAAIDIFRLDDNGKVVEHWDIVSKFPKV